MNCDGKMSFGAFVFPLNPYLLRITHSRTVTEAKTFYGAAAVSDMGGTVRRISGEGEFCGTDCIRQFAELQRLFENGGSDILYLPSQPPMLAVFESLTMTGRDIEGVIQYRFSFVEMPQPYRSRALTRKTADGSCCLWDYAYESGLSIETLRRLNPDIMRPDQPVPAGRSVYFC